MVTDMNEAQVHQVLEGTQSLEFRRARDDEGRCAWIEWVLRRLEYAQLPRAHREPGAALGKVCFNHFRRC